MREKNLRYGRVRPIRDFQGVLGTDSEYEYREFEILKNGPTVIPVGWERVFEGEDSFLYRRRKVVRPQSSPISLEEPVTPGE